MALISPAESGAAAPVQLEVILARINHPKKPVVWSTSDRQSVCQSHWMPAVSSLTVLSWQIYIYENPHENNLKIRELQRMPVKGKLFPVQGNFHTE